MIDNIKTLWQMVDNKTEFIRECAKDLDRAPTTLRVHWFAQFWQIPEEHQERVVELLQNWIKQQQYIRNIEVNHDLNPKK